MLTIALGTVALVALAAALAVSIVKRRVRPYTCREEWLADIYGDVDLEVIARRLKRSGLDVLHVRRAVVVAGPLDQDPPKVYTHSRAAAEFFGGLALVAAPAFGALAGVALGDVLTRKRRRRDMMKG